MPNRRSASASAPSGGRPSSSAKAPSPPVSSPPTGTSTATGPGTRERHPGRLETPLRGARPRRPPTHRRHRQPGTTCSRRCRRVIHVRQHTSSLAVRDGGDGRTLVGPLLPWGREARVADRGRLVTETFERGALQGTDPAAIPLTATHPRDA